MGKLLAGRTATFTASAHRRMFAPRFSTACAGVVSCVPIILLLLDISVASWGVAAVEGESHHAPLLQETRSGQPSHSEWPVPWRVGSEEAENHSRSTPEAGPPASRPADDNAESMREEEPGNAGEVRVAGEEEQQISPVHGDTQPPEYALLPDAFRSTEPTPIGFGEPTVLSGLSGQPALSRGHFERRNKLSKDMVKTAIATGISALLLGLAAKGAHVKQKRLPENSVVEYKPTTESPLIDGVETRRNMERAHWKRATAPLAGGALLLLLLSIATGTASHILKKKGEKVKRQLRRRGGDEDLIPSFVRRGGDQISPMKSPMKSPINSVGSGPGVAAFWRV